MQRSINIWSRLWFVSGGMAWVGLSAVSAAGQDSAVSPTALDSSAVADFRDVFSRRTRGPRAL